MKKKILGRNVEPRCKYCQYGTPAPDEKNVLCPKKGVIDRDSFCKKFRYDPLKRIPREKPALLTFSEGDFSLTDASEDFPLADPETAELPVTEEEMENPADEAQDLFTQDENGDFILDENDFILE